MVIFVKLPSGSWLGIRIYKPGKRAWISLRKLKKPKKIGDFLLFPFLHEFLQFFICVFRGLELEIEPHHMNLMLRP